MIAGRRLYVVASLIFLGAALLTVRLAQLQLAKGAALTEQAIRQRRHVETIFARPGDIVDRNGRLMAVSVHSPSLYVVPKRIRDKTGIAHRLASVLDIDANELAERLLHHRSKEFFWVRRRLTEEQATAIRGLELPHDVWGFRDEFLRCYPQGVVAAHVLGMRDIDNIGRGGVEQRYERLLKGKDGYRVILRDARGRAIDIPDDLAVPPVPGRTIVLSIDSVVQLFAERILDQIVDTFSPKGACAIVIDTKTSELLALASRPTFDPSNPSAAPAASWTNRAISDVYEPGSTFKPLVVAWALHSGVLDSNETLNCEGGVYRTGRRLLHDHHGYGELSVTDVLVKSSNIGMAKIGERLGVEGLHHCVRSFGFGQLTGVALPGEQPGNVRPLKLWNDYSIGSIPMGHEIAVTPLQLIMAHTALANGGRLMSPRLVLRDVDPVLQSQNLQHRVIERPSGVSSPVVNPDAAQWVVREAMTEVVKRGTGQAARLKDFTVFGKTGTAQKLDPESGTFSHSRHVVSFVAGAPAENPRVIVLVMVDEPAEANQAGGTVAAPAAAKILQRTLMYLGVTPDDLSALARHAGDH